MLCNIENGRIGQDNSEIVNDIRTNLVAEKQDFIVPGHLAANPNVEVLSNDRHPLEDGCPHPYLFDTESVPYGMRK